MEASHLITEIKGVGVKTTALFSKLHIETIKDLISYFREAMIIMSRHFRLESCVPVKYSR